MSHSWSNRSAPVVFQADGTFEWYCKWLQERYPNMSNDARVEQAEFFTASQLPPITPREMKAIEANGETQ